MLGCTHYPLLRPAIAACVGPDVHIVDSGARDVAGGPAAPDRARFLECAGGSAVACGVYVSDNPGRFRQVGSRFLNESIEHVEWVEPERYVNANVARRPE